jgi:hypothetical protein
VSAGAAPTTAAPPLAGAFPPAVAALFAAGPHRPGSVDAVLVERAVPLTLRTRDALYAPAPAPRYRPGSRPELERFVAEALAGAVHPMPVAAALTQFVARIPHRFPTAERPTAAGFYGDFAAYLCGGTEEEVIKKGSPLAAERARVLCAMAQVAGLPARVVLLARDDPPERHAVAEIFVLGRWTVFDGYSGRFYVWPKHGYLSAWDARQLPALVNAAPDHGRRRYVDGAFFRHVAIAAYDVADFDAYRYPWDLVSPELAARLRAGLGA